MPSLNSSLRSRLWALGLLAIGLGACSLQGPKTLNPQPEDPTVVPTGGTDNETGGTGNAVDGSGGHFPGTGGISAGGANTGGRMPTGGMGAQPPTGGATSTGGLGAMGGSPATGGLGTGGSALGGTGTGGAALGGWSNAGGAGGVGPQGGGAGGWGATTCVGTTSTPLLDDAADCDSTLVPTAERSGTWFAYDSSPALTGSLFPPPGSFQMTTAEGSDCAAHVAGGGYPDSDLEGHGYAGIGFALTDPDGAACSLGYDATIYDGLALSARGSGTVRLLVETVATAGSSGRPNGYVLTFPVTGTWSDFEFAWSDLQLLDQSGGAPLDVDLEQILSFRFEPVNPTGFDFWIDDVAFVLSPTGTGGTGGASAAGGTGGVASSGGAAGDPLNRGGATAP